MGTLRGYAFFANRINPTSDTLALLIYLEAHHTLSGSQPIYYTFFGPMERSVASSEEVDSSDTC